MTLSLCCAYSKLTALTLKYTLLNKHAVKERVSVKTLTPSFIFPAGMKHDIKLILTIKTRDLSVWDP